MDLEKLATSAIEKEIAKTDLLSSFINSGDKEPCWDGHIYIHEDKKKTKKNIKKVAAQVKGKAVRTRDAKRTISYPISCDDLRAYMMNGGTVFFVVYLNKDTGDVLQIYYVSLLPVMVKKLLDEKKSRRTISVKFHKFPADNARKTELFLNFYEESKKQVSFAGKDLPNVDDLIKKGLLENISFSYTGLGACPDTRLLPKIIDGKSLTLYANIKGGTAPIPIEYFDEITNITTSKDTNIPISVKGHIYYDKVKTIATADTIEQQIGSSVKIIAPNVDKVDSSIKIHLNINLTGTLTEQIEALEFIIALVDNEAFNFGDAEFPAKFPQSELDRMEACNFPEMLSNRKHIKEVLDSMNVKKDLELSKCTSDDIDNLMRIVNSIGDHRIIRGEIDEKNPGQKIKIANLTVAVVYIKANGGYRIYDFFGNRFDVKWAPEGMEPVEVSQFMMMRPDDYLTLDNLDLEKVVENFKIIPPSTTHFELSNNCMLSMLNAYDKAPNPELLNAARQMNVWLGQHTDFLSSEIVTLNRLQIELRERPLEFSEKQELYTIATTAKDEFQRLGAFLLLDEQEEARKIFDTLEEDKLNLFKGFPIYKFYKYAEEKGTDGQTENANSEQG
jgi:hypothetical protein